MNSRLEGELCAHFEFVSVKQNLKLKLGYFMNTLIERSLTVI